MILPIAPGDVIDNTRLTAIFKCSPQGGMRRSKSTNTLVIVKNDVKSLYKNEWQGDILLYTGMGRLGDQSLNSYQNKTLKESGTNGVDVHLFEMRTPKRYTYIGRVELAGKPEQDTQKDCNGTSRQVWRFPLRRCRGETDL